MLTIKAIKLHIKLIELHLEKRCSEKRLQRPEEYDQAKPYGLSDEEYDIEYELEEDLSPEERCILEARLWQAREARLFLEGEQFEKQVQEIKEN